MTQSLKILIWLIIGIKLWFCFDPQNKHNTYFEDWIIIFFNSESKSIQSRNQHPQVKGQKLFSHQTVLAWQTNITWLYSAWICFILSATTARLSERLYDTCRPAGASWGQVLAITANLQPTERWFWPKSVFYFKRTLNNLHFRCLMILWK